MQTAIPENMIQCTQCGGELHPDEGQIFLTCPYCSATIYLDKSQVVFHWSLAPTLDAAKARGVLMAWMAGNQTVKDLDKKAQVVSESFAYFPMWYFKRKYGAREEIHLEPAAATSISELRHLQLPAGDLRKYDPALDGDAVTPTVPLNAAQRWLGVELSENVPGMERALVHIPIYTFKYAYQGGTYTAVVEAGTGKVFANLFPAKAEAPYMYVGCLTAFVFSCLAIFPVIMSFSTSEGFNGVGIGAAICIGGGVIAAPILFAIAAYVAAKV